jgi:hypothetical protein
VNYHKHIRATAGNKKNLDQNWKVVQTAEKSSLFVITDRDLRLCLIAGQQIQTRERLEVLAVASGQKHSEGQPLEILISEIREAGGLVIVPWGFGKWIGRRGRILKDIMRRSERGRFFLGDNSGRPRIYPEPTLFQYAKRKDIQILPGSDPLPFRNEINRAGSFGIAIQGELSKDYPAEDLKKRLLSPDFAFKTYGQYESMGRFLKNQLLMQW